MRTLHVDLPPERWQSRLCLSPPPDCSCVAARLRAACCMRVSRTGFERKRMLFSRNGFPEKRMDHQITAANISQLHRAAAQYNMSDPRHTCKRLPAMRPFSGTLIPLLKGPCMARTVNAVRLGTSRMSSPAQHTGTLTMSCPASLCPPLQPTAKRRDRPPELCVLPPPRPAAMLWGAGVLSRSSISHGGFIIPAEYQGHASFRALADADVRSFFGCVQRRGTLRVRHGAMRTRTQKGCGRGGHAGTWCVAR